MLVRWCACCVSVRTCVCACVARSASTQACASMDRKCTHRPTNTHTLFRALEELGNHSKRQIKKLKRQLVYAQEEIQRYREVSKAQMTALRNFQGSLTFTESPQRTQGGEGGAGISHDSESDEKKKRANLKRAAFLKAEHEMAATRNSEQPPLELSSRPGASAPLSELTSQLGAGDGGVWRDLAEQRGKRIAELEDMLDSSGIFLTSVNGSRSNIASTRNAALAIQTSVEPESMLHDDSLSIGGFPEQISPGPYQSRLSPTAELDGNKQSPTDLSQRLSCLLLNPGSSTPVEGLGQKEATIL